MSVARLARLFTRPANLLVLDEPTNDLDLETLELLEAQLVEWPGTLLLVSHDRAFLDNVVTSTFVFGGDGTVEEYVGGYEDWLRQRKVTADAARSSGAASVAERPTAGAAGLRSSATSPHEAEPALAVASPGKKLTYRERLELEKLPARIEALEAERLAVGGAITDPAFYKQPAAAITAALERATSIEHDLTNLYARWNELDSRNQKIPSP